MRYAAAETPAHCRRVIRKAVAGIPVYPSTLIFQRLGYVVMAERYKRFDALFNEGIDKSVVKAQTFFVKGAFPVWLNPGPGDGETVGF